MALTRNWILRTPDDESRKSAMRGHSLALHAQRESETLLLGMCKTDRIARSARVGGLGDEHFSTYFAAP